MFKEMPGRVNTLVKKFPKEFKCFGIEVSDIDISYKKSQMQFSTYQTPYSLNEDDEDMCEHFHEELNAHPEKILEQMNGADGGLMGEAKKVLEKGKETRKEMFGKKEDL